MARTSDDAESAKKRVSVTAKVDPRFEEPLDSFGRRLRDLGVHQHGTGGKSNAIEAILEMAMYMEWFDNPETFAAELMRYRADVLAQQHTPKKK